MSYIVRVPVRALHVVLVDSTTNSKAAFQNFVAILILRWLFVQSDWDLQVKIADRRLISADYVSTGGGFRRE